MNNLAPANALQKGSTIYVDGMPAKIETAQVTIETLYVTWMDESYRPVTEPSEMVLTGTLEVAVAAEFCSAMSQKVHSFVKVRLVNTESQFFADSLEITGMGDVIYGTLSLSASQTKYVPTGPNENDETNASPLALPPELR